MIGWSSALLLWPFLLFCRNAGASAKHTEGPECRIEEDQRELQQSVPGMVLKDLSNADIATQGIDALMSAHIHHFKD
jgi:hypothetical protein